MYIYIYINIKVNKHKYIYIYIYICMYIYIHIYIYIYKYIYMCMCVYLLFIYVCVRMYKQEIWSAKGGRSGQWETGGKSSLVLSSSFFLIASNSVSSRPETAIAASHFWDQPGISNLFDVWRLSRGSSQGISKVAFSEIDLFDLCSSWTYSQFLPETWWWEGTLIRR
jgi:hypothetical protein